MSRVKNRCRGRHAVVVNKKRDTFRAGSKFDSPTTVNYKAVCIFMHLRNIVILQIAKEVRKCKYSLYDFPVLKTENTVGLKRQEIARALVSRS